MNEQNYFSRVIKILVALIGVLLIAVISYQIISNRHFKVSGTEPDLKHVATVTPFLKINFNRTLSNKDVVISSSYNVMSSYSISGKSLTINLKGPLAQGYLYSIHLKQIKDTKGEVLTNKNINFTPVFISGLDLPRDQQQALLKTQQNKLRTKDSINYTGTDSLLNIGITNDQLDSLEQYIFSFKPKTSSVVFSNINPVPHDPNSDSDSDVVNFDCKIDSTTYQAHFTYTFEGGASLLLSDQSGQTVFDSKSLSENER